jgi:hypothetical protein
MAEGAANSVHKISRKTEEVVVAQEELETSSWFSFQVVESVTTVWYHHRSRFFEHCLGEDDMQYFRRLFDKNIQKAVSIRVLLWRAR